MCPRSVLKLLINEKSKKHSQASIYNMIIINQLPVSAARCTGNVSKLLIHEKSPKYSQTTTNSVIRINQLPVYAVKWQNLLRICLETFD